METVGQTWDAIAEQYRATTEDRKSILLPLIASLLDDGNPKSIVDHGGGDGWLLHALLASPTLRGQLAHCALVDPSDSMRRAARRLLPEAVPVVRSIESLPKGDWDIVVQVAVWMCLPSVEDCLDMLGEVRDLLKHGGRFIAAVTHPCFRDRVFNTYRTDFSMAHYGESGRRFKVLIGKPGEGVTTTLEDTHWSLGDMTGQLERAGFVMRRLWEPQDIRKESEGSPWLLLETVKE